MSYRSGSNRLIKFLYPHGINPNLAWSSTVDHLNEHLVAALIFDAESLHLNRSILHPYPFADREWYNVRPICRHERQADNLVLAIRKSGQYRINVETSGRRHFAGS